ncbi:MAG: AmmeMemoRadiSam system protein B [Candidatus Uhrbacteria bacterium]
MIVFAAFTPHTPLLLPPIGKDALQKLSSTTDAMDRLGDELREARPDTIVIISAHATQHDGAFSANLHDSYLVDLRDFGDLTTTAEFEPNLSLIDAIQRAVRRAQIPFTLDSDSTLDYGTAVPLVAIGARAQIVPISFSNLPAKDHFSFGKALKDVLANRKERIAIVASGDLSHALTSDAPAGYRPEGETFDSAVRQAVVQASASQLLTLDEETVEKAEECAYRPLLVLFGILDQVPTVPEVLSYEHPFGVGYLVAQFHLGS